MNTFWGSFPLQFVDIGGIFVGKNFASLSELDKEIHAADTLSQEFFLFFLKRISCWLYHNFIRFIRYNICFLILLRSSFLKGYSIGSSSGVDATGLRMKSGIKSGRKGCSDKEPTA